MDVDFGSLLFGFQGRINRAKYWIATITYISATIALVGLGFFFSFNAIFFIIAAIVFLAGRCPVSRSASNGCTTVT